MAPKKDTAKDAKDAATAECLVDIRNQLKALESLDAINKKLDVMQDRLEEIQFLKEENAKMDQQIKILTNRVEDLDQQNKINDVIITGLKILPLRVGGQNRPAAADEQNNRSVEAQVDEFLKTKNITLDLGNVDSCHLLPKRGATEGRAVLLRFTSRKYKIALLKQGKNLKGSNVFINENLTKQNATIFWRARQLKKEGKIQSTWTANCKIYVKPNGSTPENTRPVLIRALEELEKFAN